MDGAEAARLRGAMRSRRAHGGLMVPGEGEGLKGCAARTGKPASALDPLARTRHLADMPFRKRVSAAAECHLYFAQSDISNGGNL